MATRRRHGVAAFVLVARDGDVANAWVSASLTLAIGWCFVASGLLVWAREEENPLGRAGRCRWSSRTRTERSTARSRPGGILRRSVRRLAGDGRARDAAVHDLAALVRLSPRDLELHPWALSGGTKQRVAIAGAFAGSPRVVICDEPVSDLDASVQAAILNLVRDLREQEGVSYLFISHDLAVVRYVADRIGVMYLGSLVELGPAATLFDPPHHPYTEALLSAVPTVPSDEQRPRITLYGPLPSPSRPPTGCRFHTRCPRFLGDVCRTVEPPWQDDGRGHRYRCHIPPLELAGLQRVDRVAGRPPMRAELAVPPLAEQSP